MKKLLVASLIAVCLGITGCAHKETSMEDISRAMAIAKKASSQHYSGFTREELLNASKNVLYLIDPSDMGTLVLEDKVIGVRNYMLFMVFNTLFGNDTWVIRLTETGEKEFDISVAALGKQNVGMFATIPSARSPEEVKPDFSALSEADIKLFFDRLDYFLGKNTVWHSCKEAEEWAKSNNYQGIPFFICGGETRVGIEDKDPSYLEEKI